MRCDGNEGCTGTGDITRFNYMHGMSDDWQEDTMTKRELQAVFNMLMTDVYQWEGKEGGNETRI